MNRIIEALIAVAILSGIVTFSAKIFWFSVGILSFVALGYAVSYLIAFFALTVRKPKSNLSEGEGEIVVDNIS